MAEGLERRTEATDSLEGQTAIDPVTRRVPGAIPARTPSTPDTSFSGQIAGQVNKYVQGRLGAIQKKRQERSMMDGQIAGMQGQSFENVEMEGDKWALEGWRVVTAESMASSLLRSQEAEIAKGAYENDPDTYRNTLVNRIDGMTSDIPDERTRELAREQLMQQMPGLVDAHMKQNLAFKEQQNFDALTQSVDVLSRGKGEGSLVDFATGASGVTAGLSQTRRKEAVTQGVVNAFVNNNHKAYQQLDDAGFLNTENLTASQLGKIRAAKSQYENRVRNEFSLEFKKDLQKLDDRVQRGELTGSEAVEEQARIQAKHGMEMNATEGNQMYDRARAGVEIAQGTRGLNIEAAGLAGDYRLQADLLQSAVIRQESGGNPNAVSKAGATGIMQLMPATAADPGFGVRNIFRVARDMGRVVMGETPEIAEQLMRDEEVNKAMGTEYLTAMLRETGGDVEAALIAYNGGLDNAKRWLAAGKDWSAFSDDSQWKVSESKNYVESIMGSISDGRPDVQGQRDAAVSNLKEMRQRARMAAYEAISESTAVNDELFKRGEIGTDEWRERDRELRAQYGVELDNERLNQEQGMIRSVVSDRIESLQQANDTAQAVKLQTGLANAENNLAANRQAFIDGTTDMTMQDINQQFIDENLSAYQDSGADFDPKVIGAAAGKIVRDSVETVSKADTARQERAIRANAESSYTGGQLPADQQQILADEATKRIEKDAQNLAAENPEMSATEISAYRTQKEVEYFAEQGIVDEGLKQVINLAAGDNWITKDGKARPTVVRGLHAFTSLYANNKELAYQYVSDPRARGRMLAAASRVTTMFPDATSFTNVDMNNQDDPMSHAFFDAVEQVGLNVQNPTSVEDTATRVSEANRMIETGNLTNSSFGSKFARSTFSALVPGALTDLAGPDQMAAGNINQEEVQGQFKEKVKDFIEENLPYMPGVSNDAAVSMGLDYVSSRGAVMGSTFYMPPADEPSVEAQMFPGTAVDNPAAVNTAVVEWFNSEEAREGHPTVAEWQDANTEGFFNNPFGRVKPPAYTVTRINGNYVAYLEGLGSVVLPIREIGDRYKRER